MALFLPAIRPSLNLYCGDDAKDFFAAWGVHDAGGESVDDWNPSFPIAGEIPNSLLAAENGHMPYPDYVVSGSLPGSIDLTARQDAINWILKVSEFYCFGPHTAYLAVNYLDRFLSHNFLPEPRAAHRQNFQKHFSGAWAMQLLSVGCLSAAAKMEETHVPLLLDLQILNPKFVFEPRTICRMELLLMSTLRWRMRSITPFDFLPYFGAAIRTAANTDAVLSPALFSRSTDLILRTRRVIDFLRFRPSTIAAAAVLCAASDFSSFLDASSVSFFPELASKEKMRECRQLMEDYLKDSCPSASVEKSTSPEREPRSPIGVLDAAAFSSCETQRSSSSYITNSDAGATDFRPAKRHRFSPGQAPPAK